MNYYIEKQYSKPLPDNAKKDLKIFFFDSFFKDSKKILDIGCSIGRVLSIYPKRIQGIDIDPDAIKICRSNHLIVTLADFNKKLPFNNMVFDGVYCSQIIEHLENPLRSLMEVKRILTSKGRAIFITPDFIVTHAKKKEGFWSDYTHKAPFTKESLIRISFDAGFSQFRVYHFPGKLFRNVIRRGIVSKGFWIRIERYLPSIFKGQDLILEAIK